ncbi:MAG: NlpC/P60 family protein [Lachnospiraceae bacterium]|nr:NlpC/P60 family protein [Lachnospiraceae bacterium]
MKIRQKEEARDIDTRNANLRAAGKSGIWSRRSVAARRYSEKPEFRENGKDAGYTRLETGYKELSEESREVLASLTREQRKQWNNYSRREQQQIWNTAEKKAERRLRYQDRIEKAEPAFVVRKDKNLVYRISDEGRNSSKTQNAHTSLKATREIRAPAKTEKTHKADDCGADIYVNTRISREQLEAIRQNRMQKAFRQRKQKQPVPVIREARQRFTADQKQRKMQEIQMQKMETASHVGNDTEDRDAYFQKEPDKPAVAPREFCQNKTRDICKRNPEKAYHGTFYLPYSDKRFFWKKAAESRNSGEVEKESAAKKIMVARELGTLLDQDARKRESIQKLQKSEMVEQAELERETAANAVRTVVIPIRIKAAEIKIRIQKKAVEAAAGIGKYLALVGGAVVLLLFMFTFFAALFGSLAGEEEENSTMYSVSGSEIVEYAQSWIGITQYAYGAGRDSATDWQDYSDCSAFVHGVFSHFGIEIGWTTTAMEDIGTEVEGGLSDALPGDIVLFYDGWVQSGNSSHVGIYAGDGMMVHNSVSRGVCMSSVGSDGRQYVVRRVLTGTTSGNSTDNTNYTEEQMEIIWAIVCQEDGGSYAGALAVISTAMNRVDSAQWSHLGSNAYEQLTASGQFCYSIDSYWQRYLGGNVPDYVKQAVSDCLENGIRNHFHTSFRSYYTEGSEQIGGGNYYFG